MADIGWIEFNGTELVNLSRTAQLAETLGIDSVVTRVADVQWIQDARGEVDYDLVEAAPWYDPGYLPSAEFAGVIAFSMAGISDSSLTRDGRESTGNGGTSGVARNARQVIVANVALVASTERGAEYGKRWLDRLLSDRGAQTFCSGVDLRYFRYADEDAPIAHRRNVKMTRGTTITRQRTTSCSSTWVVSFTLTADDPFEYGEEIPVLSSLGGVASGPALASSGSVDLVETGCPQFDYSPVYDPLYPALVASPTAPNITPAGWNISVGMSFRRYWARIAMPEPSSLGVVPVLKLLSPSEARRIRVSIWSADSPNDDQCGPLFSAVVNYLPIAQQFYVDGEQQAAYVWDGFSPYVRRTDSLVFSPLAGPVEWSSLRDPSQLLVTMDTFAVSGGFEGNGDVRASLALVPKSD